jgi:hypothetical protein
MFREKLSQVPPVPEDYSAMPPPLRIASPPRVVTIYNKLTGGGGSWCVFIRVPSLPGPSFVHIWPHLLSFPASQSSPVRLLGQVYAAHKKLYDE